jgi:hypothetical protein
VTACWFSEADVTCALRHPDGQLDGATATSGASRLLANIRQLEPGPAKAFFG